MPTRTRPAADFTPEQLRFPPTAGFTIRGDFMGGEIPLTWKSWRLVQWIAPKPQNPLS